VTPLGPSGIFFSNHYKDFLNTWLAGKLLKNPIDGVDLRKEALGQVVFKPTEHGAASLKSF
jgi:acyl-homoserine lactone acylase PvdQ